MKRGADISIAQLRALLAVAQEGSYTRAAARLGVSQSGVSHAMQALEALAGGPLITRTHQGLGLTALGEQVLPSARKITNELQVLGQHIDTFHDQTSTALKIGVIPSALHGWMAPLLARFSQRYPQAIDLVLEGMEEEIKTWVESGVIDIGITTDLTQLNQSYWQEHFDWQRLKSDEILAVVPRQHSLCDQASIALEQLAEYPLIMSSGGCEALIQHLFTGSQEEVDTVQVDFWVRHTQTLLQMVAGGVGVSLVPRLALADPPAVPVSTLPLAPARERNLIAFWPKRRPLNPVGRHWLGEITASPTPRSSSR
ncbi:LysR family transcriptional regulator [Vreelandella sp. EE22]